MFDDDDAPNLSPAKVARFFGVHQATLYQWLRDGRFPAPTRIGGKSPRWSRRQLLDAAERWRGSPATVKPPRRAGPGRPRKAQPVAE
jgi:predicted DNA-binding transcriptional regulator AlpA